MANTIWHSAPPPTPKSANLFFPYLAVGMIALVGAGIVGRNLRVEQVPTTATLQQAVSTFDGGNLGLGTAEFQKMSDAGDPHAAYWYGHALSSGLGTAIDPRAAIVQYKKALAGGVTRAATALGELYLNGNLIPPQFSLARNYFMQAAHGGDADAALDLGHMLRDGIGGPTDPVQSYAWLEVAALRGNAQAKVERNRVLPTLSLDQQAAASQLVQSLAAEHTVAADAATPSPGTPSPGTPSPGAPSPATPEPTKPTTAKPLQNPTADFTSVPGVPPVPTPKTGA